MNGGAAYEREVESKLEQDKAVIQALTQREMLRARLQKNIAAQQNSRTRITRESQLTVEKQNGKEKRIKGQRKQQNFFVRQEEIMDRVMRRLDMPPEAYEAAEEVRRED